MGGISIHKYTLLEIARAMLVLAQGEAECSVPPKCGRMVHHHPRFKIQFLFDEVKSRPQICL